MNHKASILTIIAVLFTTLLFSQSGRINGKVIDSKTGELLIGASITILPGGGGVISDQKGEFSFLNLKPGVYTLNCTYIGYNKKSLPDVQVKAGDVTLQDIILSSGVQSNEIVIKASPRVNKENTSALLITQKNSANFSDGISQEAIKKTPDRSTSDVLKRVSGAAIQDDKFAIIRGLNDRYNAAFINGAPLPSSESDKKSFAFDIFPSNILDNLVILKTATPDQTAEFAGGIINLTTKSIPDKDFQSISFGLGYNTNATFKENSYYKGGRWDFLGISDGSRDLPYNFPNKEKFLSFTNAEQAKYGRQLSGYDWNTYKGLTSPNFSFQYSAGMGIPRKGKDYFGALISLSYNRNNDYYTGDRNSWEATVNSSIGPFQIGKYNDQAFSTESLLGFLANFTLKLNSYNTISFKNLLSINSENRTILRNGLRDFTQGPDDYFKNTVYWFTTNKIINTQLIGDHFIKPLKLKINWVGSFADIKREIPNQRRMQYRGDLSTNTFLANIEQGVSPVNDGAGIFFFARNQEKLASAKVDISKTFEIGRFLKNDIKFGTSFQDRNRNFDARTLQVLQNVVPGRPFNFNNELLELPVDQIFQPSSFATKFPNGTSGFMLEDASRAKDAYEGKSTNFAYYLMMDTRISSFLRLIYGVRNENFKQNLFSLGDSFNDSIRVNNNQQKFFPSASAVVSLSKKMNLRFAYSETVNRPEFRELAPFVFYDVALNLSISGNPLLKNCIIKNTDIRYEFYPGRAQLLSVSVFNKELINPIELFIIPATTNFATYDYVPSGNVKGIELEFRTVLGALFNKSEGIWDNLTFFSNMSFVKSEVKTVGLNSTRQLQGQSPYILNGGITYANPDNGLSFNLIANRIGPRIIALGVNGTPDFFENARTVVDFQAAVTIKKDIDLKLNVRDLLAPDLVLFNDYNANSKYDKSTDLIFGKRNFGRTISVSFSYKF
jgi:outer membrane receptor for ferrienterochelin and colicin